MQHVGRPLQQVTNGMRTHSFDLVLPIATAILLVSYAVRDASAQSHTEKRPDPEVVILFTRDGLKINRRDVNPLPYTEDFDDSAADFWQPQDEHGHWLVANDEYQSDHESPANAVNGIAKLDLRTDANGNLPNALSYEATLRNVGNSSSQLVFDY